MKNKLNNKLILAIELVLIIAGLVLSCMGAFNTICGERPESTEPKMINGAAPSETDPKPAEDGTVAPPEATEPTAAPAEGTEPPAEGEAPLDGAQMQDSGSAFSFEFTYIIPILIYILLLVYVLIDYKRPHGNLLRVTMLIFAFMLAIWAAAQGEATEGCIYILPCTTVIIAYLSGRLNKIKKNIVWFAIAGVFLLAYGILQTVHIGASYGILQFSYCFGALLQLITLALAYFGRYDEHKEAGNSDTSENK